MIKKIILLTVLLGSAYGVYAFNATEAEPTAASDDVVLEANEAEVKNAEKDELASFDEATIGKECEQYAKDEGVEGDQLEAFLDSCIIQLVDEYQAKQDLEESADSAHPEDSANDEAEQDEAEQEELEQDEEVELDESTEESTEEPIDDEASEEDDEKQPVAE